MRDQKYIKRTWYDSRLKILPSTIHGKGLFTALPIRKGEVITIIGGVVLTEDEFNNYVGKVPKYNAIQIAEGIHLVDTTNPPEFMDGSINHSCDSNAWMQDEVTLVARIDIAQGEEITVDYALFTTHSDWVLKECQCGSPYCRHIVSGSDWKIESVQKQYLGHFSPYINESIRNITSS